MEKKLCGAKTRSDRPCKKAALANGRCRLHGGKSTGPKNPSKLKGNKNALKHGLYETIWEDTLTEEERELLAQVSTDPKAQVESELKLSEIRILRMMRRIKQEEQKKKPNPALIRAIEEGITRIGMNKVSLVRESSRLLEVQGNKSDGSLDRLVEILDQARKQRMN
ncbi:HGGxSTG domain-containing protein [Brevibacillus fortis]|uniref:HGGxSTG domain-containing protein n=1 Tax=Brevibacillus fortis TaxID=2126352 RepID=UPI0038FC6690